MPRYGECFNTLRVADKGGRRRLIAINQCEEGGKGVPPYLSELGVAFLARRPRACMSVGREAGC